MASGGTDDQGGASPPHSVAVKGLAAGGRRSPGHSGTPGRNAQRTLRVKEPLPKTRDPSLRTRLQDMPLTYARVCLDDGR